MNVKVVLLSLIAAGTAACGGRAGGQQDDAREVVRLLLGTLSLDSLCGCQHVVVDPVVRKVAKGFIAPPPEADTLMSLSAEDLSLIRGATSVTQTGISQWPYFSSVPQDTLALAIYEVDSVPSLRDQRFFALVVVPPGGSMRGWSWTASRVGGRWRGSPLSLYYEP